MIYVTMFHIFMNQVYTLQTSISNTVFRSRKIRLTAHKYTNIVCLSISECLYIRIKPTTLVLFALCCIIWALVLVVMQYRPFHEWSNYSMCCWFIFTKVHRPSIARGLRHILSILLCFFLSYFITATLSAVNAVHSLYGLYLKVFPWSKWSIVTDYCGTW